ncbi:MAG: hypothetical protein ACK2T0_14875 [Anaerolineales bacterium]|jgi:hypothetical protein
MFENLRDSQHTVPANMEDPAAGAVENSVQRPSTGFLGMTPGQRLAVAILVLISVCVLGTTCLLVTGAIRTF